MDFNNRVGHKTGSGPALSAQQQALVRRERLRKLALEVIDLKNDPYMHMNHVGKVECKLCLTLHINEGSYLTHTQSKKHQTNLKARQLRENQIVESKSPSSDSAIIQRQVGLTPAVTVTKIRDPITSALGLRVTAVYGDHCKDNVPRHRILSSFEAQSKDTSKQYLVLSCVPYENVAVEIPAGKLLRTSPPYLSKFDPIHSCYNVQIVYADNTI